MYEIEDIPSYISSLIKQANKGFLDFGAFTDDDGENIVLSARKVNNVQERGGIIKFSYPFKDVYTEDDLINIYEMLISK